MSRVDDAGQLFSDGTSCSQAVFLAFAPSFGVDPRLATRLAAPFAAGMRLGAVCGAASGALLVLGLAYGGGISQEERMEVTAAVDAFNARFLELVGAVDCPGILGCDVRSPEGKATVQADGLRQSRCLPAVRTAAAILEEMLADG